MGLNDKFNFGHAAKITAKTNYEEPQDTTKTHQHLEVANELMVKRGKTPPPFRHGPSTSTPEYHVKEPEY